MLTRLLAIWCNLRGCSKQIRIPICHTVWCARAYKCSAMDVPHGGGMDCHASWVEYYQLNWMKNIKYTLRIWYFKIYVIILLRVVCTYNIKVVLKKMHFFKKMYQPRYYTTHTHFNNAALYITASFVCINYKNNPFFSSSSSKWKIKTN